MTGMAVRLRATGQGPCRPRSKRGEDIASPHSTSSPAPAPNSVLPRTKHHQPILSWTQNLGPSTSAFPSCLCKADTPDRARAWQMFDPGPDARGGRGNWRSTASQGVEAVSPSGFSRPLTAFFLRPQAHRMKSGKDNGLVLKFGRFDRAGPTRGSGGLRRDVSRPIRARSLR